MRSLISIVLGFLLIVPVGFAATVESPDTAPVGPVAMTDACGYTAPATDLVTWTTGANMPTPRYSQVTGWWDGILYVAHGRISNSAPYNTNVCEAYNPVANTWATMTPAPTARRMVGMGQVQIDNILYSVGGRAEPSTTVGTLEAYDMAADTWTTLASCTARWAHGAAAEGGYVYVFGGSNYTNSAERYNPGTNTWTAIAPLPVGDGWVAGASLNGKVYCIGGAQSHATRCSEYDPVTNTWTPKAEMPAARKYHTAVGDPVSGKIYVFGGEVSGSSTASTISYDPAANVWADEGNMPATRIWSACGADPGGDLYVVGGSSVVSPANYQTNTWIGSVGAPPVYDVTIALTYVSGSPVPAPGGPIVYDATITNNETMSVTFDAWISVIIPTGAEFVLANRELTLAGGASIMRQLTLNVPGTAPPGTYTMMGRTGDYPGVVWDDSSFTFTKSASGDGVFHPAAFTLSGWDEPGETTLEAAVPTEFTVLGNYPNPFNPTTTISFALDQSNLVELTVFDVTGREVVNLVDGYRNAGVHSVVFNATGLVSGIYVYRLTSGGRTISAKMVLMK